MIWIGIPLLVLLIAAGTYVGASAAVAAGYRQSAEQALQQAGADNDKIYGLVKKPPSLPPFGREQNLAQAQQDLTKAKTAVDGYETTLLQSHAIVDAELLRLRQASHKLEADSGTILVVPQRGSLDEERRRLEAATTGFSTGGEYLTIAAEQIRFASVLLDAEIALLGVAQLVEQQNVAGALAQFPQVDSKVQQTLTMSKGEHVAPQLQTLTNSLAAFTADFKLLLQAVQAGDAERVQTLLPKLEQDEKASASFDATGYDAYQAQLAKPYVTRYEQAMKRAGFTLIG